MDDMEEKGVRRNGLLHEWLLLSNPSRSYSPCFHHFHMADFDLSLLSGPEIMSKLAGESESNLRKGSNFFLRYL